MLASHIGRVRKKESTEPGVKFLSLATAQQNTNKRRIRRENKKKTNKFHFTVIISYEFKRNMVHIVYKIKLIG